MKCWFVPVAAVMFVLLASPGGWAGSPTEDLQDVFAAAAGRILDDPEADDQPDQRLSAIRAIASEIFGFREAAKLYLGPGWSARTPAEPDEFVRRFADLLERSFILGVASRIRVTEGVKVDYVDELRDGAVATVRTTITSKSGVELSFDYRMIDGVSLAANYRAQFARVIQTSSYPELVQLMRAKVSGTPIDTART